MLNPDSVLAVIFEYYGCDLAQLRGDRKTKRTARVRMLAYWFLYELCDMSYSEIGRLLERDHTTVMNGCRRVRNDLVMTIPKALMQKMADLAECDRCEEKDHDHSSG